MSILPPLAHGSASSSSSSSPNPNSQQHGQHHNLLSSSPLSLSPSSPPPQNRTSELLRISDSHSPTLDSCGNSGALGKAVEDFGGPSEKVTQQRKSVGSKTSPDESANTHIQDRSGGAGIKSAHSKGKMTTCTDSPLGQRNNGSISSPGTGLNSTVRKAQVMNGNHLLNFHYDTISRRQPRPLPPPPRRQKIKPYNKALFLQANYKFVVLDSGNYSPESLDPDKMLHWDDIICVRYSSPTLIQCPICLDYPLCPQITTCGHIFCFPCVLRHLLMGEEDHKGDCWKKCPLCFVMISPKDLYTVYIENVERYSVGDTIQFMLLNRQKGSFIVSHKHQQDNKGMTFDSDEIYDPFSKFTFTLDVDLSVRKAKSDLEEWLVRAESGLVDDLEKLPYVCAAIEQLDQRKMYLNGCRASLPAPSCESIDSREETHSVQSAAGAENTGSEASFFGDAVLAVDLNDQSKRCSKAIAVNGACLDQKMDMAESFQAQESVLSSSYEEDNIVQGHLNQCRAVENKESYNFYQAADGQYIILHPLNVKCLLHHYGNSAMLPNRLSGRILQLETITQSEATRKRYRYLSHFSLTTTFQLCEVDLSELLPPESLIPFMDEIKKREKHRKQLAKKEYKDKIKAEAASTYSITDLANFGHFAHYDSPSFSMDDFEALGSGGGGSSSSTQQIVVERKLFSNVTKLGYAAGHDSPQLKTDETTKLNGAPSSGTGTLAADETAKPPSHQLSGAPSSGTGPRQVTFANIISRAKNDENPDVLKSNESGKKGKKPSRVLLSTSGGRRY